MIPKWALTLPWNLIDKHARRHGLDPALVGAFCYVESAGKPGAVRYEPEWKYLYKPEVFAIKHTITVDTEIHLQKFSWGILQIMGSVARELGFEDNLTKLVNPHLGIEYGILKIKSLVAKYQALPDAIASYNAGSVHKTETGLYMNQEYVNKVSKYHVDLS